MMRLSKQETIAELIFQLFQSSGCTWCDETQHIEPEFISWLIHMAPEVRAIGGQQKKLLALLPIE